MDKPFSIGRSLKLTFVAVLAVCAVSGAVSNQRAIGHGPGRPDPADFDLFHLAGELVWSGQLEKAYSIATLAPLETAKTGSRDFIPWSYPPLFAALLAPLALLPLWLAQGIFTGASLVLYLSVTRRIAGAQAWPVWLALAPSLCLNLQAGQNGLLTGGLVGVAALGLLADLPWRAGCAIAALAIKPHLALMFPILLVIRRRWTTLTVAAAGALALTGLSIAALGPQVFMAFLRSFSEVSRFMAAGAYPLPRMISLYAALLSWGVPAGPALVLHGAAAATVLGVAIWVLSIHHDQRSALGLAIAATVFLSPYLYDYDGTVFGIGLALVAPATGGRLSGQGFGLMLGCIAASLAVGLVGLHFGYQGSFGGPMLLVVFGAMALSLGVGGSRSQSARTIMARSPETAAS